MKGTKARRHQWTNRLSKLFVDACVCVGVCLLADKLIVTKIFILKLKCNYYTNIMTILNISNYGGKVAEEEEEWERRNGRWRVDRCVEWSSRKIMWK